MHLKESDKLLWDVKTNENTQITALILKAVTLRNHELYKKTQAQVQKRINDPKKGSDEEIQKEKRERNFDFIFTSGACVVGFSACFFAFDYFGK